MTDLVAIAYKSQAARDLTADDLERILLSARSFNAASCVSGVLLHHDDSFFQYFEGPTQAIAETYERIRKSTSHKDLVQLADRPISERQFGSWHMGFCETPATTLQALANTTWEESIPMTRTTFERSEGLGLLLYYWNNWKAQPRADGSRRPN